MFFTPLLTLSALLPPTLGALSCREYPPQPPRYPDDSSGIRPSRVPPIPVGSSFQYYCPGVKQFQGVSEWTMRCMEGGADGTETAYRFEPLLAVWPECQCEEKADLSKSQCPGATVFTRYADDPGDTPATVLILPLPNTTVDWHISLVMDMDVRSLDVSTADAGLVVPRADALEMAPLRNADMASGQARIELEYRFSSSSSSSSSSQTVPRWRHPCITSIRCEVETRKDVSNRLLAVVGITVAVVVGLLVVLACLVYCLVQFNETRKVQPTELEELGTTKTSITSRIDVKQAYIASSQQAKTNASSA